MTEQRNPFKDVLAFMNKFQPQQVGALKGFNDTSHDTPEWRRAIDRANRPDFAAKDELHTFRLDFCGEEYMEFVTGAQIHNSEDTLDAIVDLMYVLIGYAHVFGWDVETAWERVHHANMHKVAAQSADDSKRGYIGDVVKPEGWVPPKLDDLV